MNVDETLNKYNISLATLRNWKKLGYITDLSNITETEINEVIKNKVGVRRNKRNSNENIIPTSYIDDKRIVSIVNSIIDLKNKYSVENNQVLHEVILRILNNNNKAIPIEVETILGSISSNELFKKDFLSINIEYDDNNDFLGCLYMSLLSVGSKDVNGIFYTPYKVVNKIIQSIEFQHGKKVVDPGCGSGNFLIQAFKKMSAKQFPLSEIVNNLFGYDIDKIAVLLAKINIYILHSDICYDDIHIYQKDFLNDDITTYFDYVIGNPPWGKKYTPTEKKLLKQKYDLEFSKLDSFSQFIIKSFNIMNEKGTLAFVLPSSVLNIQVHESIRKFLLNNKIIYIKNIGREFEEIVTDVIIIKVEKTHCDDNVCEYDDNLISQNVFLQNPYCNFLITDLISSSIIKKIKAYPSYHLKDNVEYALGVVTGNNKKYLFDLKQDNTEPIISGKEIDRYHIDYSKITKFIMFDKENLQQVAKEKLYRWKNKIIYKFIGKKLCFAIENKSTLTLNSANVICLSDFYDLNYTSAILNSRITQLYFEDVYNTHKVLKNHIQSFYIPSFSVDTIKKISSIIENVSPQSSYEDNVEEIIYSELGLTRDEINYLKSRFN